MNEHKPKTKNGAKGMNDTGRRTRREVLAAAGIIAAAGLGGTLAAQASIKTAPPFRVQVQPVYYPRDGYVADLSLAGKLAVITGASRGNGLAAAIALQAQGVTVIGTSRTPAEYSLPFTLLEVDIADAASVDAFVSALVTELAGRSIDILINNAGRLVFGTPAPVHPSLANQFQAQAALATETLYLGHVRVTNQLLPLMSQTDYARLLYTVSVAGYGTGGTELGELFGQGFTHVYNSGKRALLAYANCIRGFLRSSGSSIRVSTVNPYAMNTTLADGLNPIFLEPVDGTGNSQNPYLQAVLDGMRAFLANGLPTSLIGDTHVQLLSQAEPPANVVVGSPQEPFASMGGSPLVNQLTVDENEEAAMRIGLEPRGRS